VSLVLIDSEEFELRGYSSGSDAEVEATLSKMIQHRHAVGQHSGVMKLEQHDTRAKFNVLGQTQRFGDEQIRRRNVLPLDGEMLADPCLVKT